jgi:hypothetical protein
MDELVEGLGKSAEEKQGNDEKDGLNQEKLTQFRGGTDGMKRSVETGIHRCGKLRRETENGYSVVYWEGKENDGQKMTGSKFECKDCSLIVFG